MGDLCQRGRWLFADVPWPRHASGCALHAEGFRWRGWHEARQPPEPAHIALAATLLWNFRTPIALELMLLLGFVDASAPTLRRVLKVRPGMLWEPVWAGAPHLQPWVHEGCKTPIGDSWLRPRRQAPGRAVLLAIGGAQEALLAWPGTYDIVLNKRSGTRCYNLLLFGN